MSDPRDPLKRKRIKEVLPLGIKAIDGLLTCGKGQRMGIFAGSGVGKSTLLGMIARNTAADVNVIALIGERGQRGEGIYREGSGRRRVCSVPLSLLPPLINHLWYASKEPLWPLPSPSIFGNRARMSC